jgi:hypothetical protein
MDETAGFGSPGFLPASVVKAQRLEEQAERRQAREAEAQRAERIERRRATDMTLYAAQCEARGEPVDVVSLQTGHVTGRPVSDVLAEAAARAQLEDDRAEVEARRKRGERLQFTGLLADPSVRNRAPMTETRRAIDRAGERFMASVAASQEARRRRGELEDVVPAVRPPHWASGRRRSR